MSALQSALAVAGPPQQLVLSHLSLQERLNLGATCWVLFTASHDWHRGTELAVVLRHSAQTAALAAWLQRNPCRALSVKPRSPARTIQAALAPLPPALIVGLQGSVPFGDPLDLSAFPQLQRLELSHAPTQAVQSVARLPQLTRLVLRNMETRGQLPAWQHLRHLSRLQHLEIEECSEGGLAAALPSLRSLTLLRCFFATRALPAPGWERHLQLLQALETLHLIHGRLAAVPEGLPATLRRLLITFQCNGPSNLHRLAPLTALQSLSFEGCDGDEPGMPQALADLPPLPQLAELNLQCCQLSEVPDTVAAQTALTKLNLSFTSQLRCLDLQRQRWALRLLHRLLGRCLHPSAAT
ncbi:hypothetical protein ABPG75_012919 [Micractinium tetrahymenae]